MVNISCNEQIKQVYMSFLVGAPHWSHFMDLIYGTGKTADIQIIACSKEYVESKNDGSPGNLDGISQIAQYYNERGCKIFILQMKKLDQVLKGKTDSFKIEVCQGLTEEPKVHPDGYDEIPTQRQLQESEFWLEYYWPVWATDCYDIYECLRNYTPNYFLENNCKQAVLWTDGGLSIKITGPTGTDFLKWIWSRGQSTIMTALPECRISLEGEENNPTGIDIRLLDLTMTELLSLSSTEKRNYAEFIFGMEHVVRDIMDDVESEYEQSISEIKKEILS